MHDYVTISLSNLLTDWELIKDVWNWQRKVILSCLYNPKVKGRTTQIVKAQQIMLKYKSKRYSSCVIVRNAGHENEEYEITTLENMLDFEINMLTIVLIGNSNTYVKNGKMITPRGI